MQGDILDVCLRLEDSGTISGGEQRKRIKYITGVK